MTCFISLCKVVVLCLCLHSDPISSAVLFFCISDIKLVVSLSSATCSSDCFEVLSLKEDSWIYVMWKILKSYTKTYCHCIITIWVQPCDFVAPIVLLSHTPKHIHIHMSIYTASHEVSLLQQRRKVIISGGGN